MCSAVVGLQSASRMSAITRLPSRGAYQHSYAFEHTYIRTEHPTMLLPLPQITMPGRSTNVGWDFALTALVSKHQAILSTFNH